MIYNVKLGDKVWWQGNEYVVTGEPFKEYGAYWRECKGVKTGKKIVICVNS